MADKKGGAAVEFALTAPVVLVLIAGVAEFGWTTPHARPVPRTPGTPPGTQKYRLRPCWRPRAFPQTT
jgi:hypothetical protein